MIEREAALRAEIASLRAEVTSLAGTLAGLAEAAARRDTAVQQLTVGASPLPNLYLDTYKLNSNYTMTFF